MNKQVIFAVVAQLMVALGDGILTFKEIVDTAQVLLKASGVDLDGEFHDVFVEQDGDFHLIVKKSLLDKLSIKV